MQRFHGTAARQLVLIDSVRGSGSGVQGSGFGVQGSGFEVPGSRFRVPAVARIRLLQKDMYAQLARRRHRAQIAARHLLNAKAE